MKFSVTERTIHRNLTQARQVVLSDLYLKATTSKVILLLTAVLTYVTLISIFEVGTVAAFPLAVYAPIAIVFLAGHLIILSHPKEIRPYEVDIEEGLFTLTIFRKGNTAIEPTQVSISTSAVKNVIKRDYGYIAVIDENKLDSATFEILQDIDLMSITHDDFYIYLPHLCFETYYGLKRFDQWLKVNLKSQYV